MALRRQHGEAEIEALAAKFRQSWRDGTLIKSWLKAHADELRRLVQEEDWAWTNIGRALSKAGIAYQTGNGWSGETLRKTVAKAMKPSKRAGRRSHPVTATMTVPSKPAAVIPLFGDRNTESGAKEFRIVRRRPAQNPEIDHD
jgi:hypothetical protein